MTACRRVLGFLDGFVVFFGSGGNNDNPMFLGLSDTGLSDMVENGKVFRILPRKINYKKYQVYLGPWFSGPEGQEPSYTFSSFSCLIPV
jgi:hypothetical protein